MFTVTDSVANKGGAGGDALSLWLGRAPEACRRTTASFYAACGLCRRRQRQRESTPNMTTSRTPARRPRPSPPPAAGSASPTNTGWRPSIPPQSEDFNGAYLGAKTPAGRRRLSGQLPPGRAQHRAGRHRHRHPPPVRRRQGGGHSARLSGQPEHRRFRHGGGLGLVLVPHPAVLLAAGPSLQAVRQFRPRHPGADRDRASCSSSRWPTRRFTLHEQDEEAPAGDGDAEEAAQGRSAEAAAGDDGAVQAREGQSGLRLPAASCSPFRCSSRSTRCSTSPSRCGTRLSMAGSTTCRRPIPPRSSTCSACCPSIRTRSAELPGVPFHRGLADPDGHHPVGADQAEPAAAPIRCRPRCSPSCR